MGQIGPWKTLRYTFTHDDEIASITTNFSTTQLASAKNVNPADAMNRVSQFRAASFYFQRRRRNYEQDRLPGGDLLQLVQPWSLSQCDDAKRADCLLWVRCARQTE